MPEGIEPKWQLSHTVEVGKCAAPVFDGVVAGILTMLGLPSKAATPLAWHSAQLVVMPLWLNCALAKLVQVVIVLDAVWQVSQADTPVTGMWPGVRLAMFLGTTPYIEAALAPWQFAQPPVTPLWL